MKRTVSTIVLFVLLTLTVAAIVRLDTATTTGTILVPKGTVADGSN